MENIEKTDKIWLKSYPNGVPENIEVGTQTLIDLMDEVCAKYAKNRAITCHNETITFAQTKEYVQNFAASLVELGVEKGDRVAVVMPNIMQYPLAIFAILKIGAVVVNINPLYTEAEIDYLLHDSGAKVVIILDMMAKKLNNLYNKYNVEHVIVTNVADMYPIFKRIVIPLVLKYVKHVDLSYNYSAYNFRDLIMHAKPLVYDPRLVNTDLAFLQYTGATTGRPKGAMLSHRNIVANIRQIYAWLLAQVPNLNEQVAIDALPLYHIFSLTANLFTFFFCGGENVMIPNPRDVKDMVKTLNSTPFTVFTALDTLYSHLLASKEFTAHRYPHFKYSVAGGMPARASVAAKWAETTGVIPANCYGLTETSPAVTMTVMGETFDGSVGYPISSTEVSIREINSNKLLPQGDAGVIWVRGPQVMLEYWNNPEQTAKAFDGEWFCTNDIGYLDARGKLFISGRQTDMVIVSGFNVYPVEVENVLDSIDAIKESAVFGAANGDSGERVICYIVFNNGQTLSTEEIIQKCRKSLASYKVPHEIVVVKELPKTLVGKIDKVALAKLYSSSLNS
jgi:long-chain acyl-CoA synthetase